MNPVKCTIVVVSLIFLAACTALQPSPKVASTFTVRPSPLATITDIPSPTSSFTPASTDTPNPSKTPVPTRTPVAPTSTSNFLDLLLPNGTPQSEWNGLPIMPGAINGEDITKGDKGSYAFTIKADIDTIQKFYAKELSKKGWTFLAVGEGKEGSVLAIFTNESDILTVSMLVAEKEENLVLVLLVLS